MLTIGTVATIRAVLAHPGISPARTTAQTGSARCARRGSHALTLPFLLRLPKRPVRLRPMEDETRTRMRYIGRTPVIRLPLLLVWLRQLRRQRQMAREVLTLER